MLRNMEEISSRNVRIMSTVLTVFASVIAVGVVYNNARVVLAKRAWELASLRVLGFTRAALSAVQQPASGATRSFALRSPVSGQVLRLLRTSEATVSLGTPLIELGDTSRMEVVAELLTSDALLVSPGGRVIIDRWGGSDGGDCCVQQHRGLGQARRQA